MRTALVVALMLGLLACGDTAPSETTRNEPTSTTTTQAGTEATTTTAMQPPPRAPGKDLGGLPEWFVNENTAPESLVETIGDQLGAEYVGSMSVEWPTAGLGCSDGGYDLQVITQGYVIFYYDGEGMRRVHAAESGNWKECDLGRPLEGTPVLTS